jgi:hypothetical protein
MGLGSCWHCRFIRILMMGAWLSTEGTMFHKSRVTTRRALGAVCSLALACVVVLMACSQAYGDVGVVLNESLSTSVDRITSTGHSAVYLSRICPESPVKLRLCGPGEQGSVISTYAALGENQPYEWNAVPLSVFLYGVDDPRNRPLFGSAKIKRVLEDQYQAKYLTAYCTTRSCQTGNSAEWRYMVGASLSRGIYIFVAETTEEQDNKLIAEFNSIPNVNHFNGVTRNCADFTQRVINAYFPHAARTDYINDFGMTSPKAIARSFTRYALRHPETHFRVLHFAQVPGTIKRSSEVRDGTEQLYHSKKLLVPMILFANHALPIAAAFYVLTGRFNPEHESEKYPTAEITETRNQIRLAKADKDTARATHLASLERELRADVVGTPREWKLYRHDFDAAVDDSVLHGTIPDRQYLPRVFKRLNETGTFFVDDDGALWAEFPDAEGSPRLGLSASNVLASGSDSRLAGELLLARVARELKSPKHGRESMLEFEKDWALLQDAGRQSSISADRVAPPAAGQPTANVPSAGSY